MKSLFLAAVSIVALMPAASATSAGVGPTITYVPGSLTESVINQGPWNLHEKGDPFAHDASGIVPPKGTPGPPFAGTGTPYAAYCGAVNHTTSVMQPFYFPFVRKHGALLEGFFDYRPRNEQEAMLRAVSNDWGKSWTPVGNVALALNPYCPADATDPDNLFVTVGGVKTAYGSDPNSAGDNGLGHPVVLTIGGTQRVYSLDRANGHIDSDQLVVHTFNSFGSLPAYGFVSPLSGGGYPALDGGATSTTGLQNPDAIMGAVPLGGGVTAVVYVEKTLSADLLPPFTAAQLCPPTPSFALTNLVNKKPRKKNDDVTAVRVATTTDGIHFTDAGQAGGLNDPTDVRLNGFRYLGSGSVIKLKNGHYGMFFGAGNCLDNDSDGFHFIGYAETVNPVTTAADLLNWTVINGFDNPILSTDRVADTSASPARVYPATAPVVDVNGADLLTASQVAPFKRATSASYTPPGGYNSNFFSGRVYDPQALYKDFQTVTIVFAGYNTPQPSNNLGDYRTIGKFDVRFPPGYVAPN